MIGHSRSQDSAVPAEEQLLQERGPSGTFWPKALAKRCREYWAIAMPLGSFYGSFASTVTWAMEDAAREALLEKVRVTEPGNYVPSHGVIRHEGLVFCPLSVLKVFRRLAPRPGIFVAAYAFLEAACVDPTMIRGQRPSAASKRVPVSERPMTLDGGTRRTRTKAWSPEEDMVLRRWFSCWPSDGKHHALDEEQWAIVLDKELKGLRSKASVIGRMHVLNNILRWSLTKEGNFKGKLPATAMEEYVKRMLGQRVRLPSGMGRYRDTVKAKKKGPRTPYDD